MSTAERKDRVALEAIRVAKEARKAGDSRTSGAALRQAQKLAQSGSTKFAVSTAIRKIKR